jgi:hypothetical protein
MMTEIFITYMDLLRTYYKKYEIGVGQNNKSCAAEVCSMMKISGGHPKVESGLDS